MPTPTRRPLTLALALLALAACDRRAADNIRPEPTPETAALTAPQLDTQIWRTVRATGRFEWAGATDAFVWSALNQSDNVLAVGYRPADFAPDAPLPDNAALLPAWQAVRAQILAVVLEEERKARPSLQAADIVAFETDGILPVLDVRVTQLSTVRRLRQLNLVRYAEPLGYEPHPASTGTEATASSSGCNGNPAVPGLLPGLDFTALAGTNGSAVKSGWNQADAWHGIRSAWNAANGTGIKLMVIDSGIAFGQENMGSQFNQGLSQGRTAERLVTLPRDTFLGIPTGSVETPDDGCGHGTAMASTATAPRGTDGAAVGVAWGASLVTVRAATDVLLDESRESKGVADAFALAGNRPDIRIVSMSLGRITSSSQIADGVRYAQQRGKLIFCAAGTSFGWSAGWFGVIFPASMAEVTAVTGVKDNLTQRCDDCHTGGKVEFTVVMERAAGGQHALCLAAAGDVPATVGGSSVATASTAGMAALVWSRFPTESAAQIKARLVAASSGRNNRDANLGFGRVNAGAAVGALPL